MINPSDFNTIARNLPSSIPASGSNPPLTYQVNGGGGGFEPALIFILNQAIHVTIYRNTWNGRATIGGSTLGPYCLHVTAGAYHWFRQYNHGVWDFVPGAGDDGAPYTGPVARSVELLISAISNYLYSRDEL
jgi:hypothetical protein